MTKWFCRESIVGTIKTLMIGDNIEKRYIVSKKKNYLGSSFFDEEKGG